jgi:hypothetical protein
LGHRSRRYRIYLWLQGGETKEREEQEGEKREERKERRERRRGGGEWVRRERGGRSERSEVGEEQGIRTDAF